MRHLALITMTSLGLFSLTMSAYAQDREALFKPSYSVMLKPHDEGSNIPQMGSSLFDKMFSKKLPNGQVVYDVPYPFDRVIDRIAGRPEPKPRYLTRLRNLKTFDELQKYLTHDLFIRSDDKTDDIESIFPFGRSLQKPRDGNAITNPWKSPREVVAMFLDREPHLQKLGRVKGRIFCGLVEDLHSMECISWNNEAGRFEFQIIEDYKPGHTPKVVYVNRSKCVACHQGGAPIFPKQSWLESDDNIPLESGLIVSNFGGGFEQIRANSEPFMSKLNARFQMQTGERQRESPPNNPASRFRRIKAGKYDEMVLEANKLMDINRQWYFLCGVDKIVGDQCRKLVFQAYLVWTLNPPDTRDTIATAFLRDGLNQLGGQLDKNWQSIKSAGVYLPFFFDRDPLTLVFSPEELINCATGQCTFDLVQKLVSPEATKSMVFKGQAVNNFFNPRLLRDDVLVSKKLNTVEDGLFNLAKELARFFYRGDTKTPKEGEQEIVVSDFGDWFNFHPELRKKPGEEKTNSDLINKRISAIIEKTNQIDPRYFSALPVSRERFMFALWDGVNQQKAMEYYNIIVQPTPEKVFDKLARPFQVDERKDPALALVSKSCTQCHGTSGGKSNIPQFAYASDRAEFISNIYYHRENMIKQLEIRNMPPYESNVSLTDQERATLIDYLKKLDVSAIEGKGG